MVNAAQRSIEHETTHCRSSLSNGDHYRRELRQRKNLLMADNPLQKLIERLNQTPPLSKFDEERLNKPFQEQVIQRALESGESFGKASGDLDMYSKSEEDFRSHIKSTDNDLDYQIVTFNHGLDRWFKYGENHPPYFPWRIAVILSKMKEVELEKDFLAAYCKHFLQNKGNRDQMIVKRARKKGAIS